MVGKSGNVCEKNVHLECYSVTIYQLYRIKQYWAK